MSEHQAAPEAEQPPVSVETPEVEASQQEEGKTEETPVEKVEKVVPYGAMKEERERRKEFQRKYEESERARKAFEATMTERINALYQPQPQLPDPNDPLAVQQHELQQHRAFLQQIEQERRMQAASAQEQQRAQALIGWAKGEAQEFKQETPDFDDAYKHVVQQRAAQLKAMGLDAQGVQQAMIRDEMWVYEHAHATGKNPGQIIYEMAKNTGYKPKGTSPSEKLETLQKGVEASKTLGGGSSPDRPTPQQIADMSPSDFEAFKKKLHKQGLRLSDVL